MKLAVVGVTGLVGRKMLEMLEIYGFPVDELIPVASINSIGKKISFREKEYTVVGIEDAVVQNPNLAIFSAGGAVSRKWAPEFAAVGCKVIDNSSAWRMGRDKKLVVPEVNAHVLEPTDMIIANPNCSTIQMVVALSALHAKYTIKRLVISTYQSVTGTGKDAVDQLIAEQEGRKNVKRVYPHPIHQNCLPHCDTFLENGYTKEEMKLVNETRKILGDYSIGITATAVRVPVTGGHAESVNVTFGEDFDLNDVRRELSSSEGVVVQDDPVENFYPMPVISENHDEVFVGRIRRDESWPNTLNMWIVADNLRKGAATNAVQIADFLLKKGWL